jgi:hypothetical protein
MRQFYPEEAGRGIARKKGKFRIIAGRPVNIRSRMLQESVAKCEANWDVAAVELTVGAVAKLFRRS